jgi:hypothetical protein
MVMASGTVSVLILAAWFPASALYHQHRALESVSGKLTRVTEADRALQKERRLLSSATEVARIARQQYQLVEPGQQAYEVLPANGSTRVSSEYAGDPGTQDPVTPSAAAELPPGALHGASSSEDRGSASASAGESSGGGRGAGARPGPSAVSGRAGQGGMLGRMLHSLEFWN